MINKAIIIKKYNINNKVICKSLRGDNIIGEEIDPKTNIKYYVLKKNDIISIELASKIEMPIIKNFNKIKKIID